MLGIFKFVKNVQRFGNAMETGKQKWSTDE